VLLGEVETHSNPETLDYNPFVGHRLLGDIPHPKILVLMVTPHVVHCKKGIGSRTRDDRRDGFNYEYVCILLEIECKISNQAMSMDTCVVFMLKVVARSVALGIKIRRSTYIWLDSSQSVQVQIFFSKA
jgi:hypothetical protein